MEFCSNHDQSLVERTSCEFIALMLVVALSETHSTERIDSATFTRVIPTMPLETRTVLIATFCSPDVSRSSD
jgi:hypothetical protein